MQTTPILSIEAAENLVSALEDYVDKAEADLALVVDRGGIILSQYGTRNGLEDASIVAALAAGSFAATRELALRLGETDCSALFQQGSQAHVLVNAIDEDGLLVTVFGSHTTVGLVKFYSARAIKRAAVILEEMRSAPRLSTALFTREDVNQATGGANLFQR